MRQHPQIKLILAESVATGKVIHCVGDVELSAAQAQGKLPTFKMTAYNGGLLELGWGAPVVVDLKGMKAAKSIPALRQHDPEKIVGHADAIDIGDSKLSVTGVVSATGEYAQEVKDSSINGFPWQCSIGASSDRVEFVKVGTEVKANGMTFTGPLYMVRASRLLEVSFVPIGADTKTSATVAANFKENSMTFEQWLEKNGIDQSKLSAAQIDLLKAAHARNADENEVKLIKASFVPPTIVAGGTASTPSPAPTIAAAPLSVEARIEAERKKLADEQVRIDKITNLCAGKHPAILANALREGWDGTRVELELLRAGRPSAPSGHVPTSGATRAVLAAAVCAAGALASVEKVFDVPTLEAAHKQFRHIGLQELLMQCAISNGWQGRTYRGNERDILRAAFSSNDIGDILSNVANKFLLEGWMSVEDTWKQIAAIRPVNDFKTITSYRLTGSQEYDEVGPDGQLKHGQLGNENFTNKAKTYGKILSITRQDQINDDLGALTSAPKMLGRGGALKFNTVFWTTFLANSGLFTTGNKNYQSGSDTALGIDALTAAELLFLNQTDSDGKPLGLSPEILLTPNALSTKATSLTKDLEIRDTTASTKYTTANPHAGKFRPVRSSYLGNSAISGYSVAAWYLLANPGSLAVIEACFLNGQQNPTVESSDADFSVLGIEMRGYHDFGVSLQDKRAGVKSKGTS